jgi:putative FmdB family regulatory protein
MPLYEYECEACGRRFEVIRKFSESELDACTLCGKGPVRRLASSPAIQFKGTGWYITDYASKGKSGSESSGSSKTDGKKADAGSTETPAAKTDSTSTSTTSKPSSET